MTLTPRIIGVVDDEPSVRQAFDRLLRSAGLGCHAYPSVEDYLADPRFSESACVIADIRLQGTSGLDLPMELERRGEAIPVIFITAHDTPETRQAARRAGAASTGSQYVA